jgi:hypothetical protein
MRKEFWMRGEKSKRTGKEREAEEKKRRRK